MCLVKLAFDEDAADQGPVTDIVNVEVDNDDITVTTLFGESLRFRNLCIRRVDLAGATVHLGRRAQS
ncbi:putative CooT [uncultured Pleomorphomonas sp.]|uniref:Uncharacterized protein n=2 Tax=Pleomorphomonas TaxID=261933 RepID=A0A2G9X0Y1_9HYPH|nr:CooT family nickel-binding protein [Pleomorphomonas carboxyditropha]PIP00243.1 hypothetical protein CJ014_05785 [Pleomorphomonas carboxyditropha]SCM76167.1 putative CooT [uncultured Pleomorphomonas sp.]